MLYENKPLIKADFEQTYCDSVTINLKGADSPKEFNDVTVRIYNHTSRIEVKTKYNSVYGFNFDCILSYYMSIKERDFNSVQR